MSRTPRIQLFTFDALILMILAVGATYGARTISRLRRQVAEARQLGQYRLARRIGAGGMGEVYLAEHLLLKRPCALKLIRPGDATDPRALERFEREVRLTATLSHPNIVEIYDYGRAEDGTYYYVMEYLRGLSLAELVERSGPLPPARVVYLLGRSGNGLDVGLDGRPAPGLDQPRPQSGSSWRRNSSQRCSSAVSPIAAAAARRASRPR